MTAGLQFFRSIGGTIGLALFGTILNNQFAASMKTNLPAALSKYQGNTALDNPQVLLSPAASAKIHALFTEFGAQGEQLYQAFMHAVRLSLDTAIGDLFLISAIVGVVGLVVVFFLREDPLRKTHHMDAESGEEDSEMGYESGFEDAPEPKPAPA